MSPTLWLRIGRIIHRPRRPRVRKPGQPLRLRVISGEYEGREGWCLETQRFETGEIGPGRMVPFDLDGGPHVHLKFEEIEVIDG